MLVLLLVALWFILRGDLLYVFPCVILLLCFSVLLVLRLPRLGKRELILVLFVRLFGLCLFRFVGFLFLLGSGKGCGFWLWHSLDFSLTFFATKNVLFPVLMCTNNHNKWSCQKVCDPLVYLLDNIFIRFGTKPYRQTIGFSMGTNCAPLVADLFLFCYERDFMNFLSRENQTDIIEAIFFMFILLHCSRC